MPVLARIHHSRTLAVLVAIALTGAAGADDDAPEPQLDENIASLIAKLDDVDLSVRESAMNSLHASKITPEELLRHAEPFSDLSFEQWSRIDEILRELFIASPRAGLGAGLSRSVNPPGVRLSPIIPNFPVAEVLRDDDIIISVNGIELRGEPIDDLTIRATILSYDPGDTLNVRFVRDGRHMQADVELGRYDDLSNAAPLQEQYIRAAWALRRYRLGFEPPVRPEISTALGRGAWPEYQSLGSLQRFASSIVAAGGAAVSWSTLDSDINQRLTNLRVQRFEGGVEVRQLAPERARDVRVQSVRELRRQLEAQLRVISANQSLIDDPNTDERRRLAARNAVRRAQIQVVELQAILDQVDPQPE